VEFVNGVVIIMTGRATKTLEEVIDETLLSVAECMEHNGLKLVARKTEAMVFTRKKKIIRTIIYPEQNENYTQRQSKISWCGIDQEIRIPNPFQNSRRESRKNGEYDKTENNRT